MKWWGPGRAQCCACLKWGESVLGSPNVPRFYICADCVVECAEILSRKALLKRLEEHYVLPAIKDWYERMNADLEWQAKMIKEVADPKSGAD